MICCAYLVSFFLCVCYCFCNYYQYCTFSISLIMPLIYNIMPFILQSKYHMRRYECADATTYSMCCAAQVREAQQAATHIHRYTYHIHTYRRCAWPSRSRRSETSRRGGARRRPQPRGRPATPLTTQRSPSPTPTHRFAPCVRACGSVQAEPHAHSGNTPP